jgi:hypothetical protein
LRSDKLRLLSIDAVGDLLKKDWHEAKEIITPKSFDAKLSDGVENAMVARLSRNVNKPFQNACVEMSSTLIRNSRLLMRLPVRQVMFTDH